MDIAYSNVLLILTVSVTGNSAIADSSSTAESGRECNCTWSIVCTAIFAVISVVLFLIIAAQCLVSRCGAKSAKVV